jgi:transcription-repair coupling factor (superfamily II helicase)
VSLSSIYQRVATTPLAEQARTWCRDASAPAALHLKNTVGSLPAFLLRHLAREHEGALLCLLPDADAAAYLHSDLAQLAGADEDLLLFPPTGHHPYDQEQIADPAPLIRRADALQQLAEGFDGLVVTSIDAVFELVPPAATVQQETSPPASRSRASNASSS